MASVRTVLGDVSTEKVGITLSHEHIFFGWPGSDVDPAALYDRESVAKAISSELRVARDSYGLSCVIDVSTSDMGRNMDLMAEVSRNSGVHIVAATGLYTESMGIPYYWRLRPLEVMEEVFSQEVTQGVVGSRIKCGIIKVASGPTLGRVPPRRANPSRCRLQSQEARVFQAAARVQKRLGVAITTHTDPYDWALGNIGARQLDVLEQAGADLTRCVIGHADGVKKLEHLVEVMRRGATVGIDGISLKAPGFPDDEGRADIVAALVKKGFSKQIVLSYDRSFFERRRPRSEADRAAYNKVRLGRLFEDFIPWLRAREVKEDAIHQMTVENNRRILAF